MGSFNSAFASARKSGKKEFTWNGKKYNTKLKGEGFESTPKKTPTPTPKPKKEIPEHGRDRPGGKVLVYPMDEIRKSNRPKSIFSGVASDDMGKGGVAKTGRDRFGPSGLKAAPKLSTAKKVGRAIRIGETAVKRLGRLDDAAAKNKGMRSSVDKMMKGMK